MSRALNVLVLDDNVVTALSPLFQFLSRMPGDPERFTFSILTDPVKLDAHLDAHPEIDVVLVDVAFDQSASNSTHTCLTAFATLIRRGGPRAIGLAQSHYGRTLFPFAVCQLLPPPQRQTVVGWTYKDDNPERGYPETIRILDEIASERGMQTPPPTLLRCIPGIVNNTGDFIGKILDSRLDVKLWELMSSSCYSADELRLTAGARSVQAVRRRFDDYLLAIEEFEVAMEYDMIHPLGGGMVRNLPNRAVGATGVRDPRQRAIETFAQNHRTFFQAPELEALVVQCDLRKSREAGKRSRKRVPEAWWKPDAP
ncbi:hypothetical protein ACODT3_35805 [Streptomyces sp. 4.24]|uniref:hypothetical protein n=1 Tax=Streptomyces tritrimontium TaxID=3406573 RepID=UPI003BB67E82